MFMQMKVFLFCRHSTADMALGFIDIQNSPYLRGQGWIDFPQALHTVFVNGAFTHAKLFCRLAHGCVSCYDIICDLNGSLFNIILQENPPIVAVFTVYAGVQEMYVQIYVFENEFNFKILFRLLL